MEVMEDSDFDLAVETISDMLREITERFETIATIQNEYALNPMRFLEWLQMSTTCQRIMERSEEMDIERNAPKTRS